AELAFQSVVVQHRAVTQEGDLFRAVARQAEWLQQGQAGLDQPGGQVDAGLAQTCSDLVDGQGPVARQVPGAAGVAFNGAQQGTDDILVVDEHERAGGATDGKNT